jgi:mannose-1-phosphate guanylyltransferase
MKALIMAGGQGTRFWPLSLEERPKQFLHLTGNRSMLQQTVDRLAPLMEPSDVFVVASGRYVPEIERQLAELEEDQIIVEPAPRNTAPCIALSLMEIRKRYPDEIVAVLPADHTISDTRGFHEALYAAEALARKGWLVTFGIRPGFPSTGFGYVKRGESLDLDFDIPAFRVERFTEKPDLDLARSFVSSGNYFWNGGMFVGAIARFWEELERWMPDLVKALGKMSSAGDPAEAAGIFSAVEKVSFDYGVMERTARAATVVCDIGWNDLGSWKAVGEVRQADSRGIVADGPVETVESRDCVVVSDPKKLVALVGVSNLAVVDTGDALLICDLGRTEEVREIVQQLREKKLERYL